MIDGLEHALGSARCYGCIYSLGSGTSHLIPHLAVVCNIRGFTCPTRFLLTRTCMNRFQNASKLTACEPTRPVDSTSVAAAANAARIL